MKKYLLPLIFGLTLILNNRVVCQGIYNNPDSLIAVGDVVNAKIALKKKVFDIESVELQDQILLENTFLQIAELNFIHKNYDEAYKYINKITNDSLLKNYDIIYKKSFYAYLAADFATCEYQIEQERIKSANTIDPRLSMLEILALNEMQQWDKAHAICKKELYELWQHDSSRITACNRLYSNQPKLKKAKKAEILNYIIPGAGFFYLGKSKDGLITSSLQIASLGLTAVLAWQKLYVSGFFIGFGLYGKFKTGSIRQIPSMTDDINNGKRLAYNDKLREVLVR